MSAPSRFWWRWLVAATVAVAAFGLVLVVAPAPTRRLFGLLLFSSGDRLDQLGAPAVAYVSLTHAVLGAVMFGWSVALLAVIAGPFRRGSRAAWRTVAISLAAWFVPDTAFSLWSGFWPNAVLNLGLAVVFAIPLAATRGAMRAA